MDDLLEEFDPTYKRISGPDGLDINARFEQADSEPVDPEPLPQPSAQIASADIAFRPPPAQQKPAPEQEGGGFDLQRMLSSLVGGSDGVANLDRSRSAQQASRLAQSKEGREREKHRLEMDIMAPAKKRKLEAETGKLGNETASKALAVASTPESQAMRESIAMRFEAQAAQMGGSDWGPRFAKAAENLRKNNSLSGMAALDLAKQYNITVDDLAKEAAAKFREKDSASDNARAARGMSETERHNRAMEGLGETKIDAKVQGNQDKLNDKIESLGNMEELLGDASETKKNVDVGPIATPINKLLQYTPWRNKDFNSLQQMTQSVNNEITNLRSGKAVSASEEARLRRELADLESLQDDPTFEDKLSGIKRLIAGYKKRAINQYQRKGGGETVDRSNTARESTMQPKSLTPGESSKDTEAIAWAKANPNDPRAKKILEMHGVK